MQPGEQCIAFCRHHKLHELLHPSNRREAGKETQTAHVVYFTDIVDDEKKLHAITDSACSRTLAGSGWLERYKELAGQCGVPYKVVTQNENFKFGGRKIYPSVRALVAWFNVQGRWLIMKISEVDTQVPLLLSRPVLAAMDMNYDIEGNVADFTKLGLKGVRLGTTSSGHPTIPVTCTGGKVPSWPSHLDWNATETWIPARYEAYMAAAPGSGVVSRGMTPSIFYPKKLPAGVEELLTSSTLSSEGFLHWWRGSLISRDFWVEGPEYLDRIHVTPRRHLFNPEDWSTTLDDTRTKLLVSCGEVRISTCIPCLSSTLPWEFMHHRGDWNSSRDVGKVIWIGRSRFQRKLAEPLEQTTGEHHIHQVNAEPMGHEERGDPAIPPHGLQARRRETPSGSAALQVDPPGPQGEVRSRGDHPPGQADEGVNDEAAAGQLRAGAEDVGDFWTLRGVLARGGARRLFRLGGAGGEGAAGQRGGPSTGADQDGDVVAYQYADRATSARTRTTTTRGEGASAPTAVGSVSGVATAETDDLHERLNRLIQRTQDEPPSGVSIRKRGDGLHHGDATRGRKHGGADQEPGGATRGVKSSPEGPDGAEAVGAAGDEEQSLDSRDSRSKTRLKKRLHWQKVQHAIRHKKNNKREDTTTLDYVNDSPDEESDSVTIDVHETEFEGYKEPRVTLVYGTTMRRSGTSRGGV